MHRSPGGAGALAASLLLFGIGTAAAESFPANVPRLDVADGTTVLALPPPTLDGAPIDFFVRLEDIDADGRPELAFEVPDGVFEGCGGVAIVPSSLTLATDFTRADLAALPRLVDALEYDYTANRNAPGCTKTFPTVVADFDGDGLRDLEVLTLGDGLSTQDRIAYTRLTGGAIDVRALDGRDGFTIPDGRLVTSASSDVDGDGRVDPAIHGPGGGLRVLRGRSSYPATLSYASLDRSALLVDVGGRTPFSPAFVSLGDLDADGYDDFILEAAVSAPGGPLGASSRTEGDVALVHGAPDLSVRASGPLQLPGAAFVGACTALNCDFLAAGDVDADGFDDFYAEVIEPGAGVPGISYRAAIVYGGPERLTPVANLDAFPADRVTRPVDTATGPTVRSTTYTGTESSISLGDLNGDGASDVIVGGPSVLLGTPGTRPARRALDALDGRDGFRFGTGITTSSLQGLDVDGDGLDDVVFSGRNYLPGRRIETTNPGTPPGSGASAPAAPTGFRVQAYSARALELFWSRAATPGLRYEARRGDTVLGTTDGTSLFLGSVDARGAATYSLVAIDRDGRRSSAATVSTGDGTGGNQGPGNGPANGSLAPPASLKVAVYSASALELSWSRATVPGLRYEIRRGGSTIGETNGTSLYLGSTDARRAATYEVVAIAPDGRRSAASAVNVGAGGGTGGGATGSGPAVPAGVRASVYSSNALELFWNRASVPGLRYEIRRGDTVAGTTDGTSLFLRGVDARRATVYSVIAIDRQGRRSAPGTVSAGG